MQNRGPREGLAEAVISELNFEMQTLVGSVLQAEKAGVPSPRAGDRMVCFELQKDQCGWRAGKERIVSPVVRETGSILDCNSWKPLEDFKQRSDLVLKQEIRKEVCGDMTGAFLISR